MRNMILSAAAAASALAAFSAPTFVAAQNYGYAPPTQGCQQALNNNRLAGGAIGAVAGAVLGKQLAGRNARSEGQVLGAVVGAVAGSEIGRRRLACDDIAYRGTQPAVRQSGYQNNGYGYSNYDNRGYDNRGYDNGHQDRAYRASYQPPVYQAPVAVRQQCGWGESSIRQPDGRFVNQNVWMCQGRDGNWYPANR